MFIPHVSRENIDQESVQTSSTFELDQFTSNFLHESVEINFVRISSLQNKKWNKNLGVRLAIEECIQMPPDQKCNVMHPSQPIVVETDETLTGTSQDDQSTIGNNDFTNDTIEMTLCDQSLTMNQSIIIPTDSCFCTANTSDNKDTNIIREIQINMPSINKTEVSESLKLCSSEKLSKQTSQKIEYSKVLQNTIMKRAPSENRQTLTSQEDDKGRRKSLTALFSSLGSNLGRSLTQDRKHGSREQIESPDTSNLILEKYKTKSHGFFRIKHFCCSCCKNPTDEEYANLVENHRFARTITMVTIILIILLILFYVIRSSTDSTSMNNE